jgi:Ca-activated chloride channel family protein
MTLRRLRLSLAFAACVGTTISLWAQAASELPVLKILSPGDEAFVTGPTLLRASLTPPDAVTALTFFVDGRQVCALTNPPFECDWDAGATITAHQVRAVATVKGGSRIVQTIRTKSVGYVERVDVDVVQVTVTVSDGRGKFVRSIPQSAFHVFEDGRPQTVTHFTSEDVPLELVAAIDISGSMAPAMPKLKTAVKEFLGDVPPQDQVTLLGFNDNIFTLTRKATDPAERVKAVDRLAPWGSTALYDVLLRGVEMLGRQTGRKALVVFTDGEDQGSHATINDVERRLQSSDVTLYMIGQGRGVTMEPLKKIMERLSVPTGGRALFTDSIDELHAAFADLLDELSNQYLLGYQSSNSRRDDAWRKIKVDVDGHHEVRARQGYRALAGK